MDLYGLPQYERRARRRLEMLAEAKASGMNARHSPNLKATVHRVPPTTNPTQLGRQQAVCGMIPLTDLERWGRGRWFWTDEDVTCTRCLDGLSRVP